MSLELCNHRLSSSTSAGSKLPMTSFSKFVQAEREQTQQTALIAWNIFSMVSLCICCLLMTIYFVIEYSLRTKQLFCA